MAQCILCKATIPDGTQYCENCYSKVKNKADESYLDNLLSSVTSSEDNQNTKKRTFKARKEHKEEKSENMNDDIFDGVPNDYNIFSKSDDDSDLEFLNDLFDHAIASAEENGEESNQSLNIDSDSLPEVATTDESIDEDAQPEALDVMETMEEDTKSKALDVMETMEEDTKPEALDIMDAMKDNTQPEELDAMEAMDENSQIAPLDIMEAMEDNAQREALYSKEAMEEELTAKDEIFPEISEIVPDTEEEDSAKLEQEVSSMESSLLNELNFKDEASQAEEPEPIEEQNGFEDKAEQTPDEEASSDPMSDSDQDILDLINEINNSEELPNVEDITDYGDKLDSDYHTESELERKHTSDIGDVFSDALSAVSELKDQEEKPFIDDALLSMIPNISETESSIESENKEEKSLKQGEQAVKKKKRSLFSRIFGNIREERTEEEIEQLKQQAIEEGEKREAEKKAKAEATKQKKEQAKLQKAEDAKKAKEEAAKKKQKKLEQAKAKKEQKAQRSREIQELIDEIDANEGKINKVGAGIVFALFAAIAVFIVLGTNMYTYSVAIKNATSNFEIQHYNEAYKNVYGIDIKDEDIEIYDKIMTVMFVNKQLNSYENYYNMKKYPEALDSLLKGLDRYDKYYSLAGLLGIESDLDYVRSEILDKLETTFDVSLEEANTLLSYDDQAEYSVAIYDLLANRIQISADSKENNGKK